MKMKILVFVDLHVSKKYYLKLKKKARKVDLILCAGDISIFGSGQKFILKKLDLLKKPILMIQGNHETEKQLRKDCRKTKHIEFIHKKLIKKNDLLIFGYGGGGFTMVDKAFERFGKKMFKRIKKIRMKNKEVKLILVTHAPPFKTKIDMILDSHCGNKSFKNFIKIANPNYVIAGHFHENFNKKDKVGKTIVMNPGPGGKIIYI